MYRYEIDGVKVVIKSKEIFVYRNPLKYTLPRVIPQYELVATITKTEEAESLVISFEGGSSIKFSDLVARCDELADDIAWFFLDLKNQEN